MAWTDITGPTWWYPAFYYGNAVEDSTSFGFSWNGSSWDVPPNPAISGTIYTLAATSTGITLLSGGGDVRINSIFIMPVASLYFRDAFYADQYTFEPTDSGIYFAVTLPTFIAFSGNFIPITKIEIGTSAPASSFWTDFIGCREQ